MLICFSRDTTASHILGTHRILNVVLRVPTTLIGYHFGNHCARVSPSIIIRETRNRSLAPQSHYMWRVCVCIHSIRTRPVLVIVMTSPGRVAGPYGARFRPPRRPRSRPHLRPVAGEHVYLSSPTSRQIAEFRDRPVDGTICGPCYNTRYRHRLPLVRNKRVKRQ